MNSTNTKHTPGPWAVTPDSTCSGAWLVIHPIGDPEEELFRSETFAIAKSHKTSTVYVDHPEHFKDHEYADEIRANAQLVAVAPELLEVCKVFASFATQFSKAPEDASVHPMINVSRIREAVRAVEKANPVSHSPDNA